MVKTELRKIASKTLSATTPVLAALALAFALAFALTATGCRDGENGDENAGYAAAFTESRNDATQTGRASAGYGSLAEAPNWTMVPAVAGSAGSGVFGLTLNLTGQVWIYDHQWEPTHFTGTRSITSYPSGGSGGITGGRLNFSIGRPAARYLESITELAEELELEGWERVTATPAAARFVFLELETPNGWLERLHEDERETRNAWSMEEIYVLYIFVDRDVRLRSTGWSETDIWQGFTETETFEAFDITLREGWNALHLRSLETETDTTGSWTMSLSHSDSSNIRWMLYEW